MPIHISGENVFLFFEVEGNPPPDYKFHKGFKVGMVIIWSQAVTSGSMVTIGRIWSQVVSHARNGNIWSQIDSKLIT